MAELEGCNLVDTQSEKYKNTSSETAAVDCVAIFYEEGNTGKNYWKKNKFLCLINRIEKSLLKLKNVVWYLLNVFTELFSLFLHDL